MVTITDLFGEPPSNVDLKKNREVPDDIVVCAVAVLATVAVVCRLVVKKRQRAQLQVDDWLVILALIGDYGCVSCTLASNRHGAAAHIWANTPAGLREMSKPLYAYPFVYGIGAVALKLSFCWTYMRVFHIGTVKSTLRCQTWFDKSLVICAALSIIFPFTLWLPMLGICQPISYFWDKYTGTEEGKCLNHIILWIFGGSMSAFLDFLILIIPIPKVWQLQMTWSRKLEVMGILALGGFVFIASTMRIFYMVRMLDATDATWAIGPAAIWTAMEPSLGIVSACLIVTFRPMANGVRNLLGMKRRRTVSDVESNNVKTIGSAGIDAKRWRRSGRFEEMDVDDDEVELVMVGKSDATVTTTSIDAPTSGIQVDKTFTIVDDAPKNGGRT